MLSGWVNGDFLNGRIYFFLFFSLAPFLLFEKGYLKGDGREAWVRGLGVGGRASPVSSTAGQLFSLRASRGFLAPDKNGGISIGVGGAQGLGICWSEVVIRLAFTGD